MASSDGRKLSIRRNNILRLRWVADTSQGLVRLENQDSWRVHCLDRSGEDEACLAVVADGIGGREGGKLASSLAVESITQFVTDFIWEKKPIDLLKQGMLYANAKILSASTEDESVRGMGTTLTCALVYAKDGKVFISHVGDSRAYIISRGIIRRITDDHSISGELVKKGSITEEDAMFHPSRNVLTAALGTHDSVEVSLYKERLLPNDVIILCTDGLTSLVSADEICQVALNGYTEAATKLVDLANSRGGYDNVTVVVLWREISESADGLRGEAE